MSGQQSSANARTRAWTRLRKLTGLPPGTERRAVLEKAAEMIEFQAAVIRLSAEHARRVGPVTRRVEIWSEGT